MANNEKPFTFQIPNFLSGVHTCPDYRLRPVNSLTKAKNAVIDDCGFVRRRYGMKQVGDQEGTATITHIHDLLLDRTNGNLIALREDSGNLSQRFAWLGDATGTWAEIATQTNYSATGPNGRMVWVLESGGSDKIYAPGGGGDGFAVIDCASTPTISYVQPNDNDTNQPNAARAVLNFLDRVWYSSFAFPDGRLIHYSKLGEPETHEQGIDVISADVKDGGTVQGIAPMFGRSIFIITSSECYLLTVGSSPNLLDWSLELVSARQGTPQPSSVASGDRDTYFVNQSGEVISAMRLMSEVQAGREPTALSLNVSNLIKDLTTGQSGSVGGTVSRGVYYINGKHRGALGEEHKTYSLDLQLGAWMGPHTYYASDVEDDESEEIYLLKNIVDTATFGRVNVSQDILYGAANITSTADGDAIRYFHESLTYDGTYGGDKPGWTDDLETETRTVRCELITQPLDFGFPHQEKTLKWVEIEFGDDNRAFDVAGSFDVYGQKYGADTWTLLGTVNYGTTDKFRKAKIQALEKLGRGDVFQFRIVDDSASDGPKIRGMWFTGYGENIRDERQSVP